LNKIWPIWFGAAGILGFYLSGHNIPALWGGSLSFFILVCISVPTDNLFNLGIFVWKSHNPRVRKLFTNKKLRLGP
jgi:hypothetical protein